MNENNPLANIWDHADGYEAHYSADEVAAWAEGHVESLTESGLIRRHDNSTTVICDACHEGHVEEVLLIQSPPGSAVRAYIYCPDAGRVAVPLNRLLQWAIDFTGLSRAVAIVLDLAGQMEEVVPGRIWLLGKATMAGRSREIFLARGLTWADASDIVGSCEKLNAARGALVFVPGNVPQEATWNGDIPSVVPLKTVASLEDCQLMLDRDHIESLLTQGKRKKPIKAQKSFPTPPGTQWHEVMTWVTDTQITIVAKRRRRDFTFQSAGFEEKRKGGVQDAIWGLLKVFAMRGGVIPYNGVGLGHKIRNNLKQYVSELRKRLRALIPGIDGDPVPHIKDENCYRMAFKITSQDSLTFPVPDGTEWPDVTIELLRADTIRISVPSTERYASSTYTEEPGGEVHQWDMAELESELAREYDLRMLGLAGEDRRPDPKGVALLEVLRGNGAVSRQANDDAMIKLCGVLTKLMGIDSSPFDFAPYDEKWVARFETSNTSQR